jgi:branched-chain amino acid transport system permease protein
MPTRYGGAWGFSRSQLAGLAVLVAFIAVSPFVLYPIFLIKLLCFGLFACAFNLLIGYVGLLSFGHAAYFGMAAYIAGHAAKVWGLSPLLCILAGALIAAGLGAIIGWLAIRRSGIYFSMITLALAQMVYFVCVQAPFTGGENGIQDIPRGTLFGIVDLADDMAMYWLVAAIFLAGFLLVHRIVHSPFGQVLKAIRENEPRAISIGYGTESYKLIAFVLSAALAGVAGATKSIAFGLATLPDVHWGMSGEVVMMSLVGGLGTVFGPVVGAAVIVTMQTYLAEFGDWVAMIQAVIFILCVLAFRKGVIGEIGGLLRVKL